MSEDRRPIFRVQVNITPQWATPPSDSDQILREQAAYRFAALAREVENWLEIKLDDMTEEEIATASWRAFIERLERG
jgi:hypothetical protein